MSPGVKLTVAGAELPAGTRIVTYVSRGFELMRGFDIFVRAAKRIQSRLKDVVFVVVGTDRSYYGGDEQFIGEKSLLHHLARSGEIDPTRFCFAGHVAEETLAEILSVSDLHVYLTVPFVPSWSLLDAMACGCVVLASDQACVREYVTDGENGLLCDFFDVDGLAEKALKVLADPAAYRPLGEAARRMIEEKYALDVTLPWIRTLFETVAAEGPRRPSLIAERLVRPGTLESKDEVRRMRDEKKSKSPSRQSGSPHPSSFIPHPSHPVPRPSAQTVLFCWELGRGLGHILPMLPLAEGLVNRGYRVVVALKSLSRAASQVFGRAGVSFRQAPIKTDGPRPYPRTLSLAHILADVGWADEGELFVLELFVLAAAWRNLMSDVRPALILGDHSPTALLAARCFPRVPTVATGLGFFCPPDLCPFPPLIADAAAAEVGKLAEDERRILDRANRVLAKWKAPPLERLGRLYGDADETLLQTFAELDHYAEHRPAGTRYWGPVISEGGKAPEWPLRGSRRVYAYLKKFTGLPEVLKALADRGDSTLVYADGIDAATRREFTSPAMRFETERLDLSRVGAECDLAVHNANHGTLARLLLAGRPMVQVPLTLEQRVLARAVERTGAAVTASAKDGADFPAKLDEALASDRYADAARCFAAKYADFDPAKQVGRMVGRVEELLRGGEASSSKSTQARVPAGVFVG